MSVVLAIALIAGSVWGGLDLYRQASRSRQQVALFASEAIATMARIETVRYDGSDDDRRATVHYRFQVDDVNQTGTTRLRRADRERYAAGSEVEIRYLQSDPRASWLEGYAPSRRPMWIAFALPAAAAAAAFGLWLAIRRQRALLTHGRVAAAAVKHVEKKRADKGTVWRVHYEWIVLSGATRKGRYTHSKKTPPAIGTIVPVVYDRDNPARHSRYPLSLVTLANP